MKKLCVKKLKTGKWREGKLLSSLLVENNEETRNE